MHNDSNNRLIHTLEPVRELLREVEEDSSLHERALNVRLRLDREIETLKAFKVGE